MQRHSIQRDAILENLRGRYDHPSAEMVYASLRPTYPRISLGTVYRNLQKLSEEGVILRLSDHDKDRFDANITPHIHFFCESCGSVADAPLSPKVRLLLEKEGIAFAEIHSIDISMHGICSACRNK